MITKLEWDSNFFGYNIASLSEIDAKSLDLLDSYIQKNKIDFVQTLCKIDDVSVINSLEEWGFHFADIKITCKMNIEKLTLNSEANLDFATNGDESSIYSLASRSFIYSRYYGHDSIFKESKVNEMFGIWAIKSINGEFDDFCIKVTDRNDTIGFITAKIKTCKVAAIGILAVDEKYRSKGVGAILLQSLFGYLKHKDVLEVEVSTQGRNIIAQNFYAKHGFKVKYMESWYYYNVNTNK
ncbi:hypothetical protein GCM10010912_52360 [Paenibacillus albidus]|uniref:N-acetyltransferase domain-containing protein n=1 Tax=Paenibacillus albidus TaxID=2041023 RepID=A0A917CWT6_9BACL|nr:GNAT family N-acetyltransferase [Paenibacillus albidus]GGG01075.1 hypothetical protein GCM10010912_52360 [Paenibacillus albidus]